MVFNSKLLANSEPPAGLGGLGQHQSNQLHLHVYFSFDVYK